MSDYKVDSFHKAFKFLDKELIDFCDFLDMIQIEGTTLDYDDVSCILRSVCASNNFSYYMFERGTSNIVNKALVLSKEENTVGVIMENIS